MFRFDNLSARSKIICSTRCRTAQFLLPGPEALKLGKSYKCISNTLSSVNAFSALINSSKTCVIYFKSNKNISRHLDIIVHDFRIQFFPFPNPSNSVGTHTYDGNSFQTDVFVPFSSRIVPLVAYF